MHPQGRQQGGSDQRRIAHRRQRHETGAIPVERWQLCAHRLRQARLAHPRRSDQGQQAAVVPQQAIAELADLLVAAKDIGGWDGKTVCLFFPFLCDHRVALTLDGKGGRRSFAACHGSQLDKLGGQERLFLQAQRREIGLDHHLDVGQTVVALQCPDQ